MSLTDEQKKRRLSGIGGSEIASIVGLNPYAGPLDVWLAKTQGKTVEVTAPMERGIFLEDGIARWAQHRYGWKEMTEPGTLVHPSEPLVLCTPDRIVDGVLDVSIKSPGPHVREQWGEDGSDHLPQQYVVQLQYELAVTGILFGVKRGVIVAPIDGDLRRYPIEGDPELHGMLIDAAKKFWRDHVVSRSPPPVDGSDSCLDWLRSRFPVDRGPVLEAGPEAEGLMGALASARATREKCEEVEADARNKLLAMIGDAAGMRGLNGRISYRRTKDGEKLDSAALIAELNPSAELVKKHTAPKSGFRRFVFTTPKERT